MDLLDALKGKKILIADGATGTQLQKAGLPAGCPPEFWNIENPEAIVAHHLSYLEAGSDIILTNTFGGNYSKLRAYNLETKTGEINTRAAELARTAAGSNRFVFGDVGPTGHLLSPLGDLSEEEAIYAFKVQISALIAGGVDAILIETMSALEEAKAAIKAAKSSSDLPILATMSFETRGRTMMGVKPSQAVNELWDLGIDVIGANCGRTLTDTLTAIQEMKLTNQEIVLMAKPNAGLPHLDNNESVYNVSPEIMAEYALKFAFEGVKIFGGCCGSNPDHIRAVAKAFSEIALP
jgi:5-methyltetrahydrofolate--homocysteine methyltransferase